MLKLHQNDNRNFDKRLFLKTYFAILCRSPLYQVSTNNPQLYREALPAWQSNHVLACSSTAS